MRSTGSRTSAASTPANSFAPLPPSSLSLTFSSAPPSPARKRAKRKLSTDETDGGGSDENKGDDVERVAGGTASPFFAPSRAESPPTAPRKVSALDAYPVAYGDASPTIGDTKDDDVGETGAQRSQLESHPTPTARNGDDDDDGGGGGGGENVESEKKASEQTSGERSIRVSHEIAPFRGVGPNAVSLVFDGVELPFVIALQRSMMEGATSWRGRSTVTAYAGVVNSQAIRENLDLLPVFVPAHYEAEMRRRARAAIAAYEAQLDGDEVGAVEDDDDDDDGAGDGAADRDGVEAARKRRKTATAAAAAARRRSKKSLEPCRTCRVFADPLSTVTHPRGYATTPRATPSTGLDAVAAAPPVGWSGNGLTAVEVEPEPLCDNCSVTFRLHARHDRNRAPWSDVTSSSFVWQPPAWYAAYRRKTLRRRGGGGGDSGGNGGGGAGGGDGDTSTPDDATLEAEPYVIRKALITHLAGCHHISATLVACRGSKFSHKRARFMASTTCAATALYRIRVAADERDGRGPEQDVEEKKALAPGESSASSSRPARRGDAEAGSDSTPETTGERDEGGGSGGGGSDAEQQRAPPPALTNLEKVRVARECCRRVFRLLPTTAKVAPASLRGADDEGDERKKSETEIARVNANPTEWLESDPRNGVRLEVHRPDHSDGCDECRQLVASFGKPDALAVERDPYRHRLRFATAGEPPGRVLLEGTEFLRRRVAHLRSAFAAYRADLVRLERKRRGSQ